VLDVPDDLWEIWKDTVPRSKNLNEAIVDFIKDDLKKKGVKIPV